METKNGFHAVGVITAVPYGAEKLGLRASDQILRSVSERKCFRSIAGVSRIDRIWNNEAKIGTWVVKELAAKVDS